MINVALALIIEDNKILIMQRVHEPYKDYWELPGGKVEPGESPEQALVRELKEELDIEVTINNLKYFDNYIANHSREELRHSREELRHSREELRHSREELRHSREGGNLAINLNVFEIKKYSSKIKNNLGQNLAWINKNDYKNYQILPVTVDIINAYF